MYLLDLGKVSFLYLCIMDLLHVLHALIRSIVDKITLIILDLRQTILNLVFYSTPKSQNAINTHRSSSSSLTVYKSPLISIDVWLFSIISGVGIPFDSYFEKTSIFAGYMQYLSIPCNVPANRTMMFWCRVRPYNGLPHANTSDNLNHALTQELYK